MCMCMCMCMHMYVLLSEVHLFALRLECDVLRLTHSCRVVNNLSRVLRWRSVLFVAIVLLYCYCG